MRGVGLKMWRLWWFSASQTLTTKTPSRPHMTQIHAYLAPIYTYMLRILLAGIWPEVAGAAPENEMKEEHENPKMNITWVYIGKP